MQRTSCVESPSRVTNRGGIETPSRGQRRGRAGGAGGGGYSRFRVVTLLMAFVLTAAATLRAQETTGSVQGRVTDGQGLAIPGVSVTLIGPQGAKTFMTDADGRYSAPLLLPGTYDVRAEMQGFKAVERGTSPSASATRRWP